MALPKKGLRKLRHGGVLYGWMIRKKPTYSQAAFRSRMTLAIQSLETETPKVLHVTLSIDRPDNWIEPHQSSIRPVLIHRMIDDAGQEGWDPEAGGNAFEHEHSVIKHT